MNKWLDKYNSKVLHDGGALGHKHGDTIKVPHEYDYLYGKYRDSLALYNNSQVLKKEFAERNYVPFRRGSGIGEGKMMPYTQMIYEEQVKNKNFGFHDIEKIQKGRGAVGHDLRKEEGGLWSVGDLYPEAVNKDFEGRNLFSPEIAPIKSTRYTDKGKKWNQNYKYNFPSGGSNLKTLTATPLHMLGVAFRGKDLRGVWDYSNVSPKQTVIVEPGEGPPDVKVDTQDGINIDLSGVRSDKTSKYSYKDPSWRMMEIPKGEKEDNYHIETYERPDGSANRDWTYVKNKSKVKTIQGENSPLQQINIKTDNKLQPRRKKGISIDSYDVTQIHDKHTTRGRYTTPQKTEELYDEYQRFKDLPNGPKLKVTPNYQKGGEVKKKFLQPDSMYLPNVHNKETGMSNSEVSMSIGGEYGEPSYLIPSFKYGKFLDDPVGEFNKTGEHLGGPWQTWKEAEAFGKERHKYVEKGQKVPMIVPNKGELINYEGVRKGIRQAESLDGKLMMNPNSTATGLYGQRFSELENTDLYKGTREEFAKDTVAQNKVFKERFFKGLDASGTTSLERDAYDLQKKYSKEINNFDYSLEDMSALSNFLGRQGARNYLGKVVRDGQGLKDVFPDKYGKGAKQPNKTPEEYLEITRPHYKKLNAWEEGLKEKWLEDQKFQEGGVIKDNRGQWAHPGEITEIDSNQITMKGVNYPVLGVSDKGDRQMMYPGKEYKFRGNKVREYPLAENGLELQELGQNTNFVGYTPQSSKWLNKYK